MPHSEATPVVGPEERRPRVLIVDSSTGGAEVCADVLTRWGYEVWIASTFEEAMDRVGQSEFDVAIVELRLPEGAGYRLIESLRALWPDLPIIATAHIPSVGSVAKAFKVGAHDYLGKPYSAAEIRVRIDEALRLKSLRQQEQSLLKVMNEKAARIATIFSTLVWKLRPDGPPLRLEDDVQSLRNLSNELADLSAKLVRLRSARRRWREMDIDSPHDAGCGALGPQEQLE
ncbi:MAG: response regulator [candidate division KSB1 bacterium]|nr:response regulator [candidate division KSB1 bacterium]